MSRAKNAPLPPQNLEAEMAVLGAMLLGDREAVKKAAEILTRDDFYRDAHAHLFDAMLALHKKGEPVDAVTLRNELTQQGVLDQIGGVSYIVQLGDIEFTTANIVYYSRIVRDMAGLRRICETAQTLHSEAFAGTPPGGMAALLDRAVGDLQKISTHHAGKQEKPVPRVVTMSDVTPKPVRWLWPRYVAFGKFGLFDGDPGVGKTSVTLQLSAAVTTGRPLLPGMSSVMEPGDVLFISYEDDSADTLRPRLEAVGADLSRFHIADLRDEFFENGAMQSVPRLPVLPDDLPLLEKIITAHNVKLVIFDPIVAALAERINANSDQHVRRVLAPVAAMAERTGAAILAIRHLNKAVGGSALYRGGGSIGFSGAARSVLLCSKHPDDAERRVLAVVKANLAQAPPTLIFRLQTAYLESTQSDQPCVEWLGESCMTADDMVTPLVLEPTGAVDRAEAFLNVRLASGPVKASDIMAEGKQAGISESALNRAKRNLGIRAVAEGSPKHGGYWTWQLPAIHIGENPDGIDRVDTLDNIDHLNSLNVLKKEGDILAHAPNGLTVSRVSTRSTVSMGRIFEPFEDVRLPILNEQDFDGSTNALLNGF